MTDHDAEIARMKDEIVNAARYLSQFKSRGAAFQSWLDSVIEKGGALVDLESRAKPYTRPDGTRRADERRGERRGVNIHGVCYVKDDHWQGSGWTLEQWLIENNRDRRSGNDRRRGMMGKPLGEMSERELEAQLQKWKRRLSFWYGFIAGVLFSLVVEALNRAGYLP